MESTQTKDHDLLIRLETKLDQVITDVHDLKNGTTQRISNLELRTTNNENWIREQKLNKKWLVTIAGTAGGVIGFILTQLIAIYGFMTRTH